MTEHQQPAPEPGGDLSQADRRLLDHLIDSGFDEAALESLPAAERERVERLMSLFGLLNDYPVQDGDDVLVHATLAGIDRYEDERATRLSIETGGVTSLRRGFRLPNLISLAAVALIAASVILPIMHNLRKQGQTLKTQNNLRYVMHAVDNYAGDYGGTIPSARAGLSGVVTSFSDAINMTPLIQADYCRLNQPEPVDEALVEEFGRSNLVLFLGDRTPVMEALRDGHLSRPLQVETSHGEVRRNILKSESAILWLTQWQFASEPSLWRPRGILMLTDDIHPEVPAD
jgi:hypothetical protein